MPTCHELRGGESVHVVLGIRPRISGCLDNTPSVHTVGRRGPI